MIPDNWLDLHTFHRNNDSTLEHELENLLHCAKNIPMKFFGEEYCPSWDSIIHGPQIFQSFI